eukprot:5693616-Amphidinium_carterae.1
MKLNHRRCMNGQDALCATRIYNSNTNYSGKCVSKLWRLAYSDCPRQQTMPCAGCVFTLNSGCAKSE